jgi:hypothetical protein
LNSLPEARWPAGLRPNKHGISDALAGDRKNWCVFDVALCSFFFNLAPF